MFKKKISIIILIIITILPIFNIVSSASNVYAADIHFSAEFKVLRLSGTSASSKIDLIFDMPIVTAENISSNDSILLRFADNSPHLGIVSAAFAIEFPSSEYLQGQSYNFSFKLNGSQTNNNTALLIAPPNETLALVLNYGTFESWYNVGDTVPSWSNFYEKGYLINSLGYSPIAVNSTQLWNNSVFNFDFTIPSDYHVISGVNGKYENKLIIFMLMRTNYINRDITLSEFSLVPTGATKQLYAQQEHNLLVEEKLSDIQEGIDEGFSNISGELEEGFSNISGELEEGFSNLLEQPEQERHEAENTGQDNVNALIAALPHYEQSLIQTFSSLNKVFNYTGTECNLEFPALYIPQINDYIPEIKLTQKQTIDFVYWIEKIPSTILILIQNVLTMGLIIFCIKQFYDVLSELFTNKGLKE